MWRDTGRVVRKKQKVLVVFCTLWIIGIIYAYAFFYSKNVIKREKSQGIKLKIGKKGYQITPRL